MNRKKKGGASAVEASVIQFFRLTAADGKIYNTQDRLYVSDFDAAVQKLERDAP